MPVILSLILLIFYPISPATAEQNLLPLGLKINSDLNSINKLNSNPSCAVNNNNGMTMFANTFEDYATDRLGLKEDCLKEICPNIQANRNKFFEVDSPLDPRYKDLDSQLMPVKLALKKMLLAETALEKDQQGKNFAKELEKKPIPITPKVDLAILDILVKRFVKSICGLVQALQAFQVYDIT